MTPEVDVGGFAIAYGVVFFVLSTAGFGLARMWRRLMREVGVSESETYHLPPQLASQRPVHAGFLAAGDAPAGHPDDVGDGDGGWPGVGELIEGLGNGEET